jgi:hypothetical protein
VTFSDEVLMAYADGELEPAMRAAVDAAIASDPEVAQRVSRHRALRERLRAAYGPVLDEPMPERLIAAARAQPKVVALRRRPASVRTFGWQWGALAASVLLAAIIAPLIYRRGTLPVVMQDGRLLARGALAQALTEQLASAQRPADPVQVGISYLARSGEYCRTFALRAASLGGVACRAAGEWRVQVLAQSAATAGSTAYRPAASALPGAVLAAVDAEISGEPLDARAEALARSRGWIGSKR